MNDETTTILKAIVENQKEMSATLKSLSNIIRMLDDRINELEATTK